MPIIRRRMTTNLSHTDYRTGLAEGGVGMIDPVRARSMTLPHDTHMQHTFQTRTGLALHVYYAILDLELIINFQLGTTAYICYATYEM